MATPKNEPASISHEDALKIAQFARKGYYATEGVDLLGNPTIIVEFSTMSPSELADKAPNKNGNKTFGQAKGQIEGVNLHGKVVYGTASLWVEA